MEKIMAALVMLNGMMKEIPNVTEGIKAIQLALMEEGARILRNELYSHISLRNYKLPEVCDGLTEGEAKYAREGERVKAIKLIRERKHLSLLEAKRCLERWESRNMPGSNTPV